MKKYLLITIIIMMAFSLNYAQTSKTEPTGSGTESDPYLVESLGNLSWITQEFAAWSKIYKQVTDIDASETATWDDSDDDGDGDRYNDPNDLTLDGDNDGWRPVMLFNGSYNGDGHIIDSLAIVNRTGNEVGFFGVISGGTIENLGVTNIDFTAYNEIVGGLSGSCKGNMVTNCYTSGKITLKGSGYKYGGFFGNIITGISEITLCHSDVTIIANEACNYVAGFVGNIKGPPAGEISNCYATGDIISGGQSCAGFVGKNEDADFYVSECYSTGDVNAAERSGGFVAYNKNGAIIENCYSLGDVSRTAGSSEVDLGAFCGYNNGSTIQKCFTIGSVVYMDTTITDKGFTGRSKSALVKSCFFDSTLSNQKSDTSSYSSIDSMAIAKTTEEMQTESTFTDAGWDFTKVWQISDNNYPKLKVILSDIEADNMSHLTLNRFELNQNYPNPFNPITVIGFTLEKQNSVKLEVYNVLGQRVAVLVNGKMTAGYHKVNFNAANISSGVYFYKITSGEFVSMKKMMLIK